MVELAIKGNPRFSLSRVELTRPAPSYSIDTVCELQKEYPRETEWFFLVGSDAARGFSKWHRWDELRRMIQFAVIPRPGEVLPSVPEGVRALPVTTPGISASEIRKRVREGLPLEGWVAPSVARYIEERGLYR